MEIQDRVNQVRKLAKSNTDAINMLLSACADMGSENGALLSVKAFDNTANHLITYFNLNASQQCNAAEANTGPNCAVCGREYDSEDFIAWTCQSCR